MALIIDDLSSKRNVVNIEVEEEPAEPIEEIIETPMEKPFSDYQVTINQGVVLCIYAEPRPDATIVDSTHSWLPDPPLTIIAEENGFGCIGPKQWIRISDKNVTRV